MSIEARTFRQVDIGIVTMKKEEYEAVLDHIGDYEMVPIGGELVAISTVRDANDKTTTIAIVRTLEQGNVHAYDATHKLIADLRPRVVMLVGICGGMPSADYTLGDVILGSRLVDFCVSSVDEGTLENAARGGPMHLSIEAFLKAFYGLIGSAQNWQISIGSDYPKFELAKAQLYGSEEWQKKVSRSISHHFVDQGKDQPLAVVGAIASSDTLLKDTNTASAWRQHARDINAIEMELAGAYRAAYRESTPILAIRGVSDIVGLKRAESLVSYAARSAAAMANWVIREGSLVKLLPTRATIADSADIERSEVHYYRRVVVKVGLSLRPKEGSGSNPVTSLDFMEVARQLRGQIQAIFPGAKLSFPEGGLHSPAPGEYLVILEKPTVALRASIEFLNHWAGRSANLPDCAIAIDSGEFVVETWGHNPILTGAVIEGVNSIAKSLEPGQIVVTDTIRHRSDNTLARFRDIGISNLGGQSVKCFQVVYEDPRILNDTGLAHAVFIADSGAQAARAKTIQALAIENMLDRNVDFATYAAISDWLAAGGYPRLAEGTLKAMLRDSHYLTEVTHGDLEGVQIRMEAQAELTKYQQEYKLAKSAAVSEMSAVLSSGLSLSETALVGSINVERLVEDYLCAAFLEIRMVANYYRSTNSFFERLSITSEFDYILKRHLPFLANLVEEFAIFKKHFLQGLHKLSQRDDPYLAAVFHNVLMLYYLNRNESVIQSEMKRLREKKIYLDNNSLYALLCGSSTYHEYIALAVSRLQKIGASVKIFDKSLEEYHQSLDSTLDKFKRNQSLFRNDSLRRGYPWIWQEFNKRRSAYANEFEVCVAEFKVGSEVPLSASNAFDRRSEILKNRLQIELERLEPFRDRDSLGDIYSFVHTAKDKPDRAVSSAPALSDKDYFHQIVLHDANCVAALDSGVAGNPHSLDKIFLTCDYSLAKGIRHHGRGRFDFVVTAQEFYEFMLPYLFIGEDHGSSPQAPKILLSSMLSREIFKSLDLRATVGDVLVNSGDIGDVKFLVDLKNGKRFREMKSRFKALPSGGGNNELEETLLLDKLGAEYESMVARDAGNAIGEQHIGILLQEKGDLLAENVALKARLQTLEDKERARLDYAKKLKKRKRGS